MFWIDCKKHLATIIGEYQSEDIKNRITLLLLYSQVSNRRYPRLINFQKISTQDIFIPHPLFIKFWKLFYPGRLSISTVTKSSIFLLKFLLMSHIIFCSNFRSHCIVISNLIRKECDCDLFCQNHLILFVSKHNWNF